MRLKAKIRTAEAGPDTRRSFSQLRECHWISRESQQLLQFRLIKSNHRLPIDKGNWGRPETQLNQLVEGILVGSDVLRYELHALTRKKLFLLFATASPRLRIHHHLLRHGVLRVNLRWSNPSSSQAHPRDCLPESSDDVSLDSNPPS